MRREELVHLEMDLEVFSKKKDHMHTVRGHNVNEARIILENATGICLGRSDWSGKGTLIITWEQYGKLIHFSKAHNVLKEAVEKAGITITTHTEKCIFHGKGIHHGGS